MDINHFFNINRQIKYNSASKNIPKEFRDWRESSKKTSQFFNWIREESNTGSLRLDIESDISEVVAEIEKSHFLGISHRADDSKGWRSIVLHGLSSIMTEASYVYVEKGIAKNNDKESWTDVSKFFPKTIEWIKKYINFSSYSRIRIMILDPGGYINPHKDFQDSFLGGGINVGLTNPPEVEFALEDNGIIPWKDGDVRMINIGKLHSVRNNGLIPRIHLLIYPRGLEWDLEHMKLVCHSYEKMKEEKNDSR